MYKLIGWLWNNLIPDVSCLDSWISPVRVPNKSILSQRLFIEVTISTEKLDNWKNFTVTLNKVGFFRYSFDFIQTLNWWWTQNYSNKLENYTSKILYIWLIFWLIILTFTQHGQGWYIDFSEANPLKQINR